jgi:hypothetical protein
LRRTLDERPFGHPDGIALAICGARGLIASLDRQAAALASAAIDEKTLQQELGRMYRLNAVGDPDFHSARQITWAIRVIEIELRTMPRYPKFMKRLNGETREQRLAREANDQTLLEKWKTNSQQPASDKVDELLQPLDEYLRLRLPTGQEPTRGDSLRELLEATAAYDPAEFRKHLEAAWERSGRAGPHGPGLTLVPAEN